ncbi:MAG: Gfo/Idh/MocA family protein [Hyphomicrobiales bacterium]
MRIALIETTHWHLPLYLGALKRSDVRVVGVTDSAGRTGKAVAADFDCPLYESLDHLFEAESLDFAFVFGRHVDMPALAHAMIAHGIPFAIEKPCGIRADDVVAVAAAADRAGLFVAVPFILRMTDAVKIIVAECAQSGPVDHVSIRFIAGPPSRYVAAGVPWMLERELGGGGPLINLGGHLIDVFRVLAGDEVASVSATVSSRVFRLAIEDTVSLRLLSRSGRLATLETGYTFPSDRDAQREFTLSARVSGVYFMSAPNGLFIRRTSENGAFVTRTAPVRYETDVYYGEFVTCVLDDFGHNRKPIAGLGDAARALRIIEAAYASGADGGVPVAPRPLA